MPEKPCAERLRLMEACVEAAQMAVSITPKHAEAQWKARLAAESAQLSYEAHIAEHGCQASPESDVHLVE